VVSLGQTARPDATIVPIYLQVAFAGPAVWVNGSANVPRNGLRPFLLLYFAAPSTRTAARVTSQVQKAGFKGFRLPDSPTARQPLDQDGAALCGAK